MKTAKLIAALVWLASAWAQAQVTLKSTSRLWLEGKSTLHPYASTATAMELAFSFGPGAPRLEAAVESQAPASLTLKIPVVGLKSEHKGLDKNLQKALKADKFPEIVFAMTDYRIVKDSHTETVVARGDLSVAGIKRPETITAALRVGEGLVVIDGEQPLLMSDFEVKPPAFMFGALKTDNQVVIKFHLELQREIRGKP